MSDNGRSGKIASLIYAQSTLRQLRDLMKQQGFDSPVYFVEMAYVVVSDTLTALDNHAGDESVGDRIPSNENDEL